jgi:hypothetical protein
MSSPRAFNALQFHIKEFARIVCDTLNASGYITRVISQDIQVDSIRLFFYNRVNRGYNYELLGKHWNVSSCIKQASEPITDTLLCRKGLSASNLRGKCSLNYYKCEKVALWSVFASQLPDTKLWLIIQVVNISANWKKQKAKFFHSLKRFSWKVSM